MSKGKKHAKKLRKADKLELSLSQRDWLSQLPLTLDFEKASIAKNIIDGLHEMRRAGIIDMTWSERKTKSYPNAMQAAYLSAIIKQSPNTSAAIEIRKIRDSKSIPVTYSVLEISRPETIDPAKAKQDMINARAGQIKNMYGKKARKMPGILRAQKPEITVTSHKLHGEPAYA